MESTYDLLRRLKSQLFEMKRFGTTSGEVITPIELLKIRKILNGFSYNINLPSKDFITKRADFDSVYIHFYGYEGNYDQDIDVINTIDPWLNELIENDYIISVERIKISENIESFHYGVFEDFEALTWLIINQITHQ